METKRPKWEQEIGNETFMLAEIQWWDMVQKRPERRMIDNEYALIRNRDKSREIQKSKASLLICCNVEADSYE